MTLVVYQWIVYRLNDSIYSLYIIHVFFEDAKNIIFLIIKMQDAREMFFPTDMPTYYKVQDLCFKLDEEIYELCRICY